MSGRRFYKMTGSGNDFVVFDVRREPAGELADADRIRGLCERGTGVGADGVVFLEEDDELDFGMSYFNSDGSRAEMCGNAALCVTALAARLGAGPPGGMRFRSDAGPIAARVTPGGPEIDMEPVAEIEPAAAPELAPGERRIGFAVAGVPHLIVLCDDVATVDVPQRGKALRWHPSLRRGANVNFLSQQGAGRWLIRTFERGVEGETLACGTGAVAAAAVLQAWGDAADEVRLETRSGREITVRRAASKPDAIPTLAGEGRLVFVGELPE